MYGIARMWEETKQKNSLLRNKILVILFLVRIYSELIYKFLFG